MVQVELRDRTSILRSLKAWNRASAESGTSLTLFGSPKIAAAIARQKSTSKPAQIPRWSTNENPGNPSFTPQTNDPRVLTSVKVGEDGDAEAQTVIAKRNVENAQLRAIRPVLVALSGGTMRQ